MKILPFVVGLIVFAITTTSHAQSPLAFRGIQLGLTVEQFKAIKFPDQDLKARPVCSNDPNSKKQIGWPTAYGIFGKLKVIICGFYSLSEYGFLNQSLIEFAGVGSYRVSFFFISVDGNPPTLFWIKLYPHSRDFESIIHTMETAFGKATSETESTVQNAMGAKYQNIIHVWRNKDYSLTVKKFESKLDEASVTYELTAGFAEFTKRHIELTKQNTKKL